MEIKKSVYLLGRCLKNSGDHLITYSTQKLLEHFNFNIKYINKKGFELLSDIDLKKVNECDYLIISGGPCICDKIYKKIYPLRNDLSEIKAKIIIFGGGKNGCDKGHYNSQDMFFKKSLIYTRDNDTKNLLNENNIKSELSGCSVWYNSGNIVQKFEENIRTILFSCSARPYHFNDIIALKIIKKKFKNIKIIVCINHGFTSHIKKSNELMNYIKNEKIELVDLSKSYLKMKNITKNIDMHIGYRVHSHLLSLSMGKKSILINIDNRGEMMSNTLGKNYSINNNELNKLNNIIEFSIKSDYNDVIKIINENYNKIKDIFNNL